MSANTQNDNTIFVVSDDVVITPEASHPVTQGSESIRIAVDEGDICKINRTSVQESEDKFLSAISKFNAPLYELFNEVVGNLLSNRDFLSLQLDHAHKNISDDEFETRSEEYLATLSPQYKDVSPTSRGKVKLLLSILGGHLDEDVIAACLRIEAAALEKIIEEILKEQ